MNHHHQQATFFGTVEVWFRWTSSKSKEAIEKFKESSQLPWWTAISCLTIGLRVAVFPLRLRAWRNGRMTKMSIEHCNKNIAPQLRELHGKTLDPQARNEAYKKAMISANTLIMKSLNLSPWKSLAPIPVSVPLFLSVAAGLRAIDYGGEGFGWFWRNFGEAAVESAVPVALSNFFYIEMSRRQSLNKDAGFLRSKLPFIIGHSLNLLSFVLLTQVPSAVNLFLLNSSVLSIIESKILMGDNPNLLKRMVEKEFKDKIGKIAEFKEKSVSLTKTISYSEYKNRS